jgi:hypothetical protein
VLVRCWVTCIPNSGIAETPPVTSVSIKATQHLHPG